MSSITKATFVSRLAQEAGITKVQAEKALDSLRNLVSEEVAQKNNDLIIPGVLTIKPTARAARVGRNPQTGEAINIPAKRAVKATLDKGLRDVMI